MEERYYRRLRLLGEKAGLEVDEAVAAIARLDAVVDTRVANNEEPQCEEPKKKEEPPQAKLHSPRRPLVVRLRRKRERPYCAYRGETHSEFFSVVNDGCAYMTPEEKQHHVARLSRERWLGNTNFLPSDKASALPLRSPGHVAAEGPFFDNVILEKICRTEDKSKFFVTTGWRPLPDRTPATHAFVAN